MIWPWTEIRELRAALFDERRKVCILERRCDWYEAQLARAKRVGVSGQPKPKPPVDAQDADLDDADIACFMAHLDRVLKARLGAADYAKYREARRRWRHVMREF
jgi:hypothetical protein